MRWTFVSLAIVASAAALATVLWAQVPKEPKPAPVTMLFLADGLHCENCVANLTRALKAVRGVQKAEVSLKEKRAIVVLDEQQTPLASLVSQTHRAVPYRLTLLVPLQDWQKVDQAKAVQTIKSLKGVAGAKQSEQGILVTFKPDATTRFRDLVEALSKEGFKVSSKTAHEHDHNPQPSTTSSNNCCDECEKSRHHAEPQGGGHGCGGC